MMGFLVGTASPPYPLPSGVQVCAGVAARKSAKLTEIPAGVGTIIRNMNPLNNHSQTSKRAIWLVIFTALMTLSISSAHAQQRTTPAPLTVKPPNWPWENPNRQHMEILQKQITQLQWQIAQMRYRLRFLRLTAEGYQSYMAEIRALEQRLNSLGWLLYQVLQNRR